MGSLVAAVLVAGLQPGPALVAREFARDVPIPLAADEPWSWAGVPDGQVSACGVSFDLSQSTVVDRPVLLAAATEAAIDPGASVVYALVTPAGECRLAGVAFSTADGPTQVKAEDCALAWASDPPRARRLLVARCVAPAGGAISGVHPTGCYLLALLAGDRAAADDATLEAAYAEARDAWHARFAEEAPAAWHLSKMIADLPDGRIALLPPRGGEPPVLAGLLATTSLRAKLSRLAPDAFVDPSYFGPVRFPVSLYVGQENYLRSVGAPGDAAEALRRYLADGGRVVIIAAGPFPMYYAIDSGNPVQVAGDQFLPRVGITLTGAWEKPPEGTPAMVCPVEGQSLLTSVTAPYPYPTAGDLRIRCLGAVPGSGVSVTPLVEVRRGDGSPVGLCAALFELPPNDQGRRGGVLFVSSILLCDGRVAVGVVSDVVRWIAERLSEGA